VQYVTRRLLRVSKNINLLVIGRGQGKISTMTKEKVFYLDQTICRDLVEKTLFCLLVRSQSKDGCIRDSSDSTKGSWK
jgi:hypothetical protein